MGGELRLETAAVTKQGERVSVGLVTKMISAVDLGVDDFADFSGKAVDCNDDAAKFRRFGDLPDHFEVAVTDRTRYGFNLLQRTQNGAQEAVQEQQGNGVDDPQPGKESNR